MSKKAHTPGPWNLIWRGNEVYPYPLTILADNDSAWIARDGTVGNPADARLIAAAPDMRAFLDHDQWQIIDRAIERYSGGEISDLHALGLITAGFLKLDADRLAAISKATGDPS